MSEGNLGQRFPNCGRDLAQGHESKMLGRQVIINLLSNPEVS